MYGEKLITYCLLVCLFVNIYLLSTHSTIRNIFFIRDIIYQFRWLPQNWTYSKSKKKKFNTQRRFTSKKRMGKQFFFINMSLSFLWIYFSYLVVVQGFYMKEFSMFYIVRVHTCKDRLQKVYTWWNPLICTLFRVKLYCAIYSTVFVVVNNIIIVEFRAGFLLITNYYECIQRSLQSSKFTL